MFDRDWYWQDRGKPHAKAHPKARPLQELLDDSLAHHRRSELRELPLLFQAGLTLFICFGVYGLVRFVAYFMHWFH